MTLNFIYFFLAALLQQTHPGGWPIWRRHQRLPSEEAEDDWAWEQGTKFILIQLNISLKKNENFVEYDHWKPKGWEQLLSFHGPPAVKGFS